MSTSVEPSSERSAAEVNEEIRALWLRSGGTLSVEQREEYQRLVQEWGGGRPPALRPPLAGGRPARAGVPAGGGAVGLPAPPRGGAAGGPPHRRTA
ncbi:hypothetical protein, partial [Streptomyces albogriseolus]|uniref:hypothetical protein n=1 Tax=Streptomyces albogriseolus TaxID=1887 RepID=UPI0036852A1B